MPPMEVISDDQLANMVRLRTSAVYEMIISLQTLLYPRRRSAWANQYRTKLSPDFWEELTAVYQHFNYFVEYIELAVDYPNHHDIPGFLDYVRQMPSEQFVFYLIGRRISLERITEVGLDDGPALVTAIEQDFGDYCPNSANTLLELTADLPAFRERLIALWERYWNDHFSHLIDELKPYWDAGLAEAERILTHRNSEALFQHLLAKKEVKLPSPLPPDHPITEIVFIPLYLLPSRAFMFYGYGKVTVLFDSEYTEARVAQLEKTKEEIVATARALGDSTRLSILRLIAQVEKINGKKIAAKLNLSASAVSRHIAQLRDGGLIVEEPIDHRNMAYQLQKDMIASLADNILDYLYS